MALFGGREEAWKFNIELCEWGKGKGVFKLWTCYILVQVLVGDIKLLWKFCETIPSLNLCMQYVFF